MLFLHDKHIGDHTSHNYQEMLAHKVLILYLRKLVQENRVLSEVDIRDFNKILLKEPFYKEAITLNDKKLKK